MDQVRVVDVEFADGTVDLAVEMDDKFQVEQTADPTEDGQVFTVLDLLRTKFKVVSKY